MIRSVKASVWYNEDETVANCYAQVDNRPNHIVMTFNSSDFDDGVALASRIRDKQTRKTIHGITASLELPFDTEEFPVWRLTINFSDTESITVEMPQDSESHYEDGTVRHNRPRGSGAWECPDNRISIHDWLELETPTLTNVATTVVPINPKLERIRTALRRKGSK